MLKKMIREHEELTNMRVGKNMDSLYIVMPAYNEEENLEEVISSWYPILKNKSESSRIVVADSGSTDTTHSILTELKKKYTQLELLENKERQHGPKVIALYKYAVEQGADFVFQTDSDGQTNPEEFEAFWDLRRKYDFVFGCRSKREDGNIRALVESVVCMMLKVYFRIKVPDANAPFRLMRTSALKKYLPLFKPDYFLPNVILTAFVVAKEENYLFMEISFKKREKGEKSVDMGKIVKIGIQSLKDFPYYKKQLDRVKK